MPVKWFSKTPNEVVLGGHSTSTPMVDAWLVSTIGAPWNASTRSREVRLEHESLGCSRRDVHAPMGRINVAACDDGRVIELDEAERFNSNGKPMIAPSEVAYSPDGTRYATASSDASCALWNDQTAGPLVGTGRLRPVGCGMDAAWWPGHFSTAGTIRILNEQGMRKPANEWAHQHGLADWNISRWAIVGHGFDPQ